MKGRLDPIVLEIVKNAYIAVPEEMGVALRRTAYSPNIKERMDASCALFDNKGRLVAQAEHIPVHLGSMPLTLSCTLEKLGSDIEDYYAGDQIIVNDPYSGGSHLPDITVIRPVFIEDERIGYAVNRAHHADVGGLVPGSMGVGPSNLDEEGIIIPPRVLMKDERMNRDIIDLMMTSTRNGRERLGDLRAQVAANNLGAKRFEELLLRKGISEHEVFVDGIIGYSERMMRAGISTMTDGKYVAAGIMEGDGVTDEDIHLIVNVSIDGTAVTADFTGTDPEVRGNINTPIGVTRSAVYYAVKCIAAPDAPPNSGCYAPIEVIAPEGCLLNPRSPRAVAGGNVETSQRIVDMMFSALSGAIKVAVPAQSQGTMNNIIIGGGHGTGRYTYYETIGGGEGAHRDRHGANAIHTNMTNTSNTPIEALERSYPLRVEEYSILRGSGGKGRFNGGDGVRRAIRVLKDGVVLTVLSDRRRTRPKGVDGGGEGRPGRNYIVRKGRILPIGSKVTMELKKGDIVVIETPGGGGNGPA